MYIVYIVNIRLALEAGITRVEGCTSLRDEEKLDCGQRDMPGAILALI